MNVHFHIKPSLSHTASLLQPLAWLYSRVMRARNRRFDMGRLPVSRVPVPVLSVGNLSVGGTGKTPHCIWLLRRLLESGRHPAMLSRGYGRKTRGFHSVSDHSTAMMVGDEPLEAYRALGGSVPVFVCEDRVEGARRLLAANAHIDCIVLDDAYQHRYLHRDQNILLTDYSRLYTRDFVLPRGRLRESADGSARADTIIVTKCPPTLSAEQAEAIRRELSPREGQQVFFSAIEYEPIPEPDLSQKRVLLFSGIAKPQPLVSHLTPLCRELRTLSFPDHHAFSHRDLLRINAAAEAADVVVTTAKDFSRLPADLPPALAAKLRVQEIGVKFLFGKEPTFIT